MNKLNNKSGFTLIEIIVVLIIVGILAAIALPNLFSNIQKSKGAQALSVLDGLKSNIESCMAGPAQAATVPGAAPCNTANIATPANSNGWTYTVPTAASAATAALGAVLAPAAGAQGTWVGALVATDNQATPNSIVLQRATTGVWTCTLGTGSTYTGVC